MKGFLPGIILAVAVSAPVTAAEKWAGSAPDYYHFTYKIDRNQNVLPNSVCAEYGGIERKNCRRYAQWKFAKKCWELGYKEKHSDATLRAKIQREKEISCEASKAITPST
ncbi:hypothetical protein [Marinobacter sp.]|uniref:hypothetical protein n=1 Tax=Marinobacter sp. TaxID=50741 RepID=UPI00198BB286|nr:hypothetical protein [Marinobacter sp.]MBD3657809.1 hypothetical protein [Marinobacter sp.]